VLTIPLAVSVTVALHVVESPNVTLAGEQPTLVEVKCTR
jgi:hypothetical protein